MHKAPEQAEGKTVACLVCRAPMTVRRPIDPAAILLQDDNEPLPPLSPDEFLEEEEPFAPPAVPIPPPTRTRKQPKTVDLKSLPPLTTNDPPLWRRHLHWLLALALIPLIVSLLTPTDRIKEAIDRAAPDERERIIKSLETSNSRDEFLSQLPDQRLPGAFLSRSSLGHWLMAALAIAAYMSFFMFLAADGSAKPMHVLFVGLFTSTIGVGFLLLMQLLASLTDGRIIFGANIISLIFAVLKFIAFSYNAALDPENGFFLSFLGFTAGVGLCEEFVKMVPLLWHRATATDKTWRSMLIWGLASGAGFGIAEGIMYSASYYNGIYGLEAYLVRFLSCVALHAIWAGSSAVLLYIRRDLFDKVENWYEWIFPIIFVIGVPALLHGLYDTCLKKDMNGVALLVAFASFGYLAFLFSRLQSVDDVAATKAMLREYERRRAALR
jgi:RsiW-degrading membrane proteinase PrsW (M82 family)